MAGRPHVEEGTIVARIEVRFYPSKDPELCSWWQSLKPGERAAAVKAALYGGIPHGMTGSVVLDTASILAELEGLVR